MDQRKGIVKLSKGCEVDLKSYTDLTSESLQGESDAPGGPVAGTLLVM